MVIAFGYVVAIGPVGIFSTLAKDILGFVPWNLYSLLSLIMIAGLTHVPHVYLYSAAALRGLSTDLEEAARVSGANPFRVAVNVSLPMILPAILFAGVLVFFLGFELFGLPLVLGDPQDRAGALDLSVQAHQQAGRAVLSADGRGRRRNHRDHRAAGVHAAPAAAPGATLCFGARQRPEDAAAPPASAGAGLPSPAIVFWLFVTVVVPLFGITLRSFVVTWGEGVKLLDVLTLDHYRELTDYPNVVRGILNTLGIGVIGGAVAVACYTAIALAVHRWNSGWTRLVDYLVMVPRAMPGLVAGLALLWVFLFVPFLSPLKSTMVSIWLAYSIVWLAYGMRLVSGTLLQVAPELEEAARTAGANDLRVKRDVTVPLIKYGMLASWLLIFLIFVREYSTGIYLLGPGTEVIGSLLVSLWGTGAVDLVSALSVVNVVMIGVGLAVAVRLGVRLHG